MNSIIQIIGLVVILILSVIVGYFYLTDFYFKKNFKVSGLG